MRKLYPYNKFITEGVRDQMTPKSEEDIKSILPSIIEEIKTLFDNNNVEYSIDFQRLYSDAYIVLFFNINKVSYMLDIFRFKEKKKPYQLMHYVKCEDKKIDKHQYIRYDWRKLYLTDDSSNMIKYISELLSITESVRDQMTPKSEEEIRNAIKNTHPLLRIENAKKAGFKLSNEEIRDIIDNAPLSRKIDLARNAGFKLSDKEIENITRQQIEDLSHAKNPSPLNSLKLWNGLKNKCIPVIEEGIREGAKIDKQYLYLFCSDAGIIECLLKLNALDSVLYELYQDAIKYGYSDVLKLLLKEDKITPTKKDVSMAVWSENFRIVHILMKDKRVRDSLSEKDKEYFANIGESFKFNESVRDKMTPKSKEEILDLLKGKSKEDTINTLRSLRMRLDDVFTKKEMLDIFKDKPDIFVINILRNLGMELDDVFTKEEQDKMDKLSFSYVDDFEEYILVDTKRIKEVLIGIGEGVDDIDVWSNRYYRDEFQNEVKISFRDNAWGGISLKEWIKLDNILRKLLKKKNGLDYYEIMPENASVLLRFDSKYPMEEM